MGVNTFTGGSLLSSATMKRVCSLCLQEYIYHNVKKYRHGLQLCVHCSDVLAELSSSPVSIFKHR
jgi:hypothetical protein